MSDGIDCYFNCNFTLYFIEIGAFTEEPLNKLPKQELVAMYLRVNKKMESLKDHLLEKVQHIRGTFKHMESELAVVKNVIPLLSKGLFDMERHCWANVQYSKRKCLGLIGMPQSVKDDDLEKVVTKVDISITERDMQAVHRIGKEGRTIIKFINRKDCQALLKVKHDLNNLTMKNFGFEENNKIYVNEILRSFYRLLWVKSKRLHHL